MKLVIVGGVAGGMSAAARARRLDESAQIIVLDKGKHVSFANCGLPYFIGDEITDPGALLVQTPQSLKAALNLDVRPEHEVVGLDAAAHTVTVKSAQGTHRESYDALILAPGANAVIPPLPGIAQRACAPCARSTTRSPSKTWRTVPRMRWCSARGSSGWKPPRPWRSAA